MCQENRLNVETLAVVCTCNMYDLCLYYRPLYMIFIK